MASDITMSILIMFALKAEAEPFLQMIRDLQQNPNVPELYSGTLAETRVIVGISGMGAGLANEQSRNILSGIDASAFIFAGFAGGLADDLSPGDVVIAKSILDEDSGNSFACDENLLGISLTSTVHIANILTVGRVVSSSEQKSELFKRYGCAAVDMESASAALVAKESGIPFLAVRAILDTQSESIPASLSKLVDNSGQPLPGKAALNFLLQPSLIGQAIRLSRGSRLAANSLARILGELVSELSFSSSDTC